MKQILLFLFVTFFFLNATAQTEECGTKIPENTTFEMASPYGLINEVEVIESFVQKHIPLALHIVQTTNGTGGLSGTILNQALTLLDAAYIQANIDFYQYSLDYINNDNYYNIDNQIEEDAIRQINVIPNAINVYFVNGFGSTAGLSSFTFSPIQGIIIKNSAATGSTFPHEIGHYFNLFHTHQTGIFTGSGWTNYEKKENIVRELESPCFNANRRGDLLIDTEADHNLLDIGGNSHVNNNCEYAPFKTFVDDCGNSNYSPNVRNIMSYSLWACRDEFTLQQIWRMHYTIENQRSELIPLRVTLKNIYNNELTGTYLKVDNTNYVSGSIVPLVYDGSYNIGTVQQKLQSNAIQHHDWNQLYHDFYISRLVTVGESKNLQDARFHDIRPIKIYSKVDGIPIGNFEFKDKWFIESNGTQPGNWKSYSGEFTPGSGNFVNYGGLFLDEEGENSYKIKFPSINQIQTQQGIRSGYFLGWSTNNVDILTPNNIVNGYYESPLIFQQANSEMAGNYKGSLISNNSNAYANNSQRKFIRSKYDGKFHSVYSSMGKIWYETKTGEEDWVIMNNVNPIVSAEAKNPSIVYLEPNYVAICYQENFGGNSSLKAVVYNYSSNQIVGEPYNLESSIDSYSLDNPIAVEFYNGQSEHMSYLLFVYKAFNSSGGFGPDPGLMYSYYTYNHSTKQLTFLNWNNITVTNINFSNPSLASCELRNYYNAKVFYLAYQEDNFTNGTSKIWYQTVDPLSSLEIPHANSTNISLNSGFTKNYKPNLITLPGTDVHSRLTWVGERTTEYEVEGEEQLRQITEKRTVFRGSSGSSFWNFGSDVRAAAIQKSNNHQNYFVSWNQIDGKSKSMNNTSFSTIRTINEDGQQIDVCNGQTISDLYGMIFNKSEVPYSFSITNNLSSYFGSQSKETAGTSIFAGREGTVAKDNTCFFYTIGDVEADGVKIEFKEITESTSINSNADVKQYLETEPFELNDNSIFIYSVQYGSTLSAENIFNENEFINYKVKLIDVNTNTILTVFDDITFNHENLQPYASLQYNVNTNGIGNKTVKLMLDIEDNFNAVYSVTSLIDDAEILQKSSRINVDLGENINVTEYDLFQNYPNPFNPSTTIRYQIPQDGIVTLKIYDILGREVKTLVNEVKTKGRYEIVFDASQFASGLYIYEITSGSFKASKKMTLIK